MSAITLRLRQAPGFRVDAAGLLPNALASLSDDEIARIALPAGNDTCTVADLFDVTRVAGNTGDMGDTAGETNTLTIDGDVRWLDRLGAGLDGGVLTVRGSCGDYAGHRMSAGTLAIDGDAQHFAGCEMRGGRLTVNGSCGDFAAAALPGDMEGMTGGTLTIVGSAGARLGDRMRRGLVLVGGDAGEFAASRLVAGTIGIAGRIGAHYAYGMRRGTLMLAQTPRQLPCTFVEGGRGFTVFWSLMVRALRSEIAPFSSWQPARLPVRLAGDLAVDGRGELLIVG